MATISILLGFFNIVAGLMLVAAFLYFLAGFIRYLVLPGTEKRNEGLALMMTGVIILFTLVVLLGIIDTLQGTLSFLIGIALVIFLCIVAIVLFSKSGGASTPEHK